MIHWFARNSTLERMRQRQSTGGNVAIEFAFVLPFLVLLVSGTYDFGRAFAAKLTLDGAARAGVQYALHNHDKAEDTHGVIQTVREDAGETGQTLTVTPNYYCTCMDGTAVACTGSCGGAEVPLRYIQVDVSRPFELMFDYPLITNPMTLEGYAELRLR